jgi:hypothetical protein
MQGLCAVLSLLAALATPPATQQSAACSLLTSDDIEAATGAKVGISQPADYPIATGDTVHACLWSVPTQKGQVSLSLGRLPAGTTAEAIAKHNPGTDGMRAKHWAEEAKDFPDAWCSIMTPPASDKNAPMMSTCSGEVKGLLISVAFLSPTKKLTIAEAKSLLDKARARQH